MKRGVVVGLFFLEVIFLIGFVSAYSVSNTILESGVDSASVSSASNAYSYEINFTLDGSVSSVAWDGFLGSDGATTNTGFSVKGDNLYVYESRLDNALAGITGDGRLFNVSYSGTLTLTGAVFVDKDGNEDHESYIVAGSSGGTSSTTSSGGGGGAAISVDTSKIKIRTSSDSLNINSVFGKIIKQDFVIYNDGNSSVGLTFEFDGDAANFITANNFLNVGAGEEKKLSLVIDGTSQGIVTGNMIISVSGAKLLEIPVIINVRSENFLFDASITVPEVFRFLRAGEKLRAQISLLQVGPKEKVDVTANYIIKDFLGRTYLEEGETFFVLEEKSFARDFITDGLPPGRYVLGMEVLYPGAFATTSSQFEIVSRGDFFIKYWPVIVFALIIISGIYILVRFLVKRKKNYRKLRR